MDKSKIDALIAKYHSWQNEIWLDVDEEIEGIKLFNMNLKHLLMLDGLESPFLTGGDVSEEDAYLFLWVVSKEFSFESKERDNFFIKAKGIPTYQLIEFIQEYIEKSFAESDTMKNGSKSQTYFIAYFVDCFAREYGWTLDRIMKIPLGVAFQLITAINERNSAMTGKEYNRITELDNKINRYILNSNSDNGIL